MVNAKCAFYNKAELLHLLIATYMDVIFSMIFDSILARVEPDNRLVDKPSIT